MSIYIKGMKMPKPKLTDMVTIYDAYVLVSPNGYATIVVDNEDGLDSTEYLLVSVPPHGRLIDADRLKNIVFESLNNAIVDCNLTPFGEALCTSIAKNIVDEIETAPTIIQANKPKKEISDNNVILKIEEK